MPFDIAVVVPRKTAAGVVRDTIENAVDGSIRDLEVFDVYEGENIPAGHRSLAFHCELFDRERTLSTQAADALRTKIIDAVERSGWSVRRG